MYRAKSPENHHLFNNRRVKPENVHRYILTEIGYINIHKFFLHMSVIPKQNFTGITLNF